MRPDQPKRQAIRALDQCFGGPSSIINQSTLEAIGSLLIEELLPLLISRRPMRLPQLKKSHEDAIKRSASTPRLEYHRDP
jgi:hypothetical protein